MTQALATLAQSQASFQSELREVERERRESEREGREFQRESEDRFRRIEAILDLHTRLLESLSVKFEALPEAIREKMGFRVPAG